MYEVLVVLVLGVTTVEQFEMVAPKPEIDGEVQERIR
ncbi:unannotated protein [freshwater metagenome]|uniref:Unannotated protein n=1 Tax=freshwater metagenome TaxID=449393 RepID=A0A6J7BMG7_9ZZZZ